MNKIIVTDKKTLDEFYKDWSLTFEGVLESEIPLYLNFIEEHGGLANDTCYFFKGKLMNEKYGLTGSNRYRDDLNFLVIKLESIKSVGAIAIPRFRLGGRWFTDIVDNNAYREEAK